MQEIRVYTTSVCPYCHAAKNLLRALNLAFSEVNLDGKPDLRVKLSQENNGFRTVPMIFVGSEFIGGYTDLKDLADKGELLPKVQRA